MPARCVRSLTYLPVKIALAFDDIYFVFSSLSLQAMSYLIFSLLIASVLFTALVFCLVEIAMISDAAAETRLRKSFYVKKNLRI